jgi:signal transduction histidine kinase
VAQELWLARLKAGQLENDPTIDANARGTLAELIVAIEAGLAETSHAVLALRARVDRPGIVPVLEEYTAEFTARFGIAVQVEASQAVPPLDARTEAESLRIVQEALNNARKHADATLVRVVLEARGSIVRITVVDNGQGFQADEPSGGFGLSSMAERARQIGGRLDVRSEPSDGTRVTLDVPTSQGGPDG